MLLHRLEQRRLRFRRRAVDLVGKNDVGEDRTGREDHLAPAGGRVFLDDVGAGDVGRHQVGRELNARELQLEHARQRVNQQRLGEPRDADDEAVAAHEEGRQYQLHRVLLADDELLQLSHDLVAAMLHPIGQRHVIRGLDIHHLLRYTLHGALLMCPLLAARCSLVALLPAASSEPPTANPNESDRK